MEKSAPTRERLLGLRAQRVVLGKGLELLKSKREALMKEFFGIVDESVAMRKEFTALLNGAHKKLEIARALHGTAVESFANAARRDFSLDVKMVNVWGVNVPEFPETALTRSLEARDISPVGEPPELIDMAREFEAAADLIVKIASRETRLTRVGEMIKADTRKINAITEMILPSMEQRIRYIERVLGEREREAVFRLKRFKHMRPARL